MSLRQLLAVAALSGGMLVSTAYGQLASVAERVELKQRSGLTEAHRRSIARRQANEHRDERGLYQFRSADGGITLTNKPKKYRDKGMLEVVVSLDQISVPQKYRKSRPVVEYTSKEYKELIEQYCGLYGLDESLVLAVMQMESAGNPNAVSHAGACGLMQLMPATAAEMGVTDIFDPAQNIAGGTQYLAKMMSFFQGDVQLALAGYNAGPEAVRKYGGIPPYDETQQYVRKVIQYWERLTGGGVELRNREFTRISRKNTMPRSNYVPEARQFMVYFNSGLKQPADSVTEKDPYYYIEYGRRTYPVRKDLVERIVEPV